MGGNLTMSEGLCLGVETSCDETAAAVVAGGRRVLSSVVSSQAALHRRYGGVVPELAARRHLETVLPAVDEALRRSGVSWSDLALLAVTRGPGLPAALLVGVAAAKALAFARDLPLVGVNHLAGHVYAHLLEPAEGLRGDASGVAEVATEPEEATGGPAGADSSLSPDGLPRPAVCLVVSGSHTDLCLLPAGGGLRLLGSTADDAAGEAFDKVARLLGLGYPGGPALERLAAEGNPRAVDLPRPAVPTGAGAYGFSFSGLKTAVAYRVGAVGGVGAAAVAAAPPQGGGGARARAGALAPRESPGSRTDADRAGAAVTPADVAAAFQAAVVDVLVGRTVGAAAAHGVRHVLLCGGVAANSALRLAFARECRARGWILRVPPAHYCTDNAAMIAAAGWVAHRAGRVDGWDLDADPSLPLDLA